MEIVEILLTWFFTPQEYQDGDDDDDDDGNGNRVPATLWLIYPATLYPEPPRPPPLLLSQTHEKPSGK